MKKPTKQTTPDTGQTGKSTNKPVSNTSAERPSLSSNHAGKAVKTEKPAAAPVTPTRKTKSIKNPQGKQSPGATTPGNKTQANQATPSAKLAESGQNQAEASPSTTQKKVKDPTGLKGIFAGKPTGAGQSATGKASGVGVGSVESVTTDATPAQKETPPSTPVAAKVAPTGTETHSTEIAADQVAPQKESEKAEIAADEAAPMATHVEPETVIWDPALAAQPGLDITEQYEPEPQYAHPPLENKYLNKEALRDRLLLRKEFKPIIAYVGRLDFQKGVNLIRHGIFYALQSNAQFVLLGISPDPRVNDEFWHLKGHLNENPDCHLEIGFNEELSHLIYAGSDMIIMPSLYEPCGLAQMIALKYGTVPIVRAVGGLVDTVFDRDYSHKPLHERNGYVFHEADAAGLESAMHRAIGLWYGYPEEFRQLMINGMKYDYSWNFPGQHYLNIYEYIRCK